MKGGYKVSGELKKGIRTEREHLSTYRNLQKYVKKHKTLPKAKSFYRMIASNHLRENPKYYTKLTKARL